jgi:hypothetical protein
MPQVQVGGMVRGLEVVREGHAKARPKARPKACPKACPKAARRCGAGLR